MVLVFIFNLFKRSQNKFLLPLFIVSILSPPSRAVEMPPSPPTFKTCQSISEYKTAVTFLRKEGGSGVSEGLIRDYALKIADGCDGAALRFSKVYLLLKKSGFESALVMEAALKFAKETDETTENFFQIFQKAYLGEFFNLDYRKSLEISYLLSKHYMHDKNRVRQDFLKIADFCLDKKKLNLNAALCAQLALDMALLSPLFNKEGVADDFISLFETLQTDKRFGLDVSRSLALVKEVISHGPLAKKNFMDAFSYAISKEGLHLSAEDGLKFSLKMAKASMIQLNKTDSP